MGKLAKDSGPTASGCEYPNAVTDVTHRVFYLEMLREIVLNYAIHDNKGNIHKSSIRSCRLVSKAWLQSTSRILLKSQQPLFNFGVGGYVSLRGAKQCGKDLDQFSCSVVGGSRLEDHIPPFSIRASTGLFRPENSQYLKGLLNALDTCRDSLVSLNLEIGDTQRILLPKSHVSFPKLRNFKFSIEKTYFHTPTDFNEKIEFVQTVIDSSRQFKSLAFRADFLFIQVPVSIGKLLLPPSITALNFDCLLNEHAMQVLSRNPLPNLKNLSFYITGLPFQNDGIITSILKNVRKTIQNLHVKKINYSLLPEELSSGPATFQFPLMERLNSLRLENMFLELHGNPSSLERSFPVLNQMALCNQTIQMFRKWVDNSCFHSVTCLKVSLCTEIRQITDFYDHLPVNFDLETMTALKNTFPNIQKLDLTFCRIQFPDPAFLILWKMIKLTSLRICVGNTFETAESLALGALLIGVPVEDVSTLDNPADLQDWSAPSIRNLTNLQTLELDTYERSCNQQVPSVVFKLAFFKMPKLTNLIFKNGLFASKDVERKWTKEGRTIKNGNCRINF